MMCTGIVILITYGDKWDFLHILIPEERDSGFFNVD
jgi:hypothetical protein